MNGCSADVEFSITNTSDIAGAEVGQVYVHQARSSVERPDIELGGFVKAHLGAGETKRVTVHLDVSLVSIEHCTVTNGGLTLAAQGFLALLCATTRMAS